MKKIKFYTYLGTNGTITSTIHLEDIYYVGKYRLTADAGKLLENKYTKVRTDSVLVPENEVNDWREIQDGQK